MERGTETDIDKQQAEISDASQNGNPEGVPAPSTLGGEGLLKAPGQRSERSRASKKKTTADGDAGTYLFVVEYGSREGRQDSGRGGSWGCD